MGISWLDFIWAFLSGGVLCVIAQILLDRTALTPARILVAYVVAGVVLGAIGVYEPFAEWAGCGATTPLTGFGYRIARGVRESVLSDGWLGAFTGGLGAAAGGITVALCSGLLFAIFFRSKPKN